MKTGRDSIENTVGAGGHREERNKKKIDWKGREHSQHSPCAVPTHILLRHLAGAGVFGPAKAVHIYFSLLLLVLALVVLVILVSHSIPTRLEIGRLCVLHCTLLVSNV